MNLMQIKWYPIQKAWYFLKLNTIPMYMCVQLRFQSFSYKKSL